VIAIVTFVCEDEVEPVVYSFETLDLANDFAERVSKLGGHGHLVAVHEPMTIADFETVAEAVHEFAKDEDLEINLTGYPPGHPNA
jgi:hypothetical protein